MTTYVARIVRDLQAEIGASLVGIGRVERSPYRAMTVDESRVVSVLPGRETVVEGSTSRATRVREILVGFYTTGDDHLDDSEAVQEIVHPVVMGFYLDGIVKVEELGTDEPRWPRETDGRRQMVTKRYAITYQTDEHSLSE